MSMGKLYLYLLMHSEPIADTIRNGILTCAQKLTLVSLIYTEPKIKTIIIALDQRSTTNTHTRLTALCPGLPG